MPPEISHRIRFNPWKHHLKWVRDQIENILEQDNHEISGSLTERIRSLNNNQVDIYIGDLMPAELIRNIDVMLLQMNIQTREDFLFWLNESEYKLLTIADGSDWVLRLGMENDHYIHIHPARNSSHVIRIHGNSWKTALIIKVLGLNPEAINIGGYNDIRRNYLSLSPVKDLSNHDRLWRTIRFLWLNEDLKK